MFKNLIFGLPMFLASLFNLFCEKENPYKKNESLMNTTLETSIKQLTSRYGLIPIGRGGGIADEKSKREYVAFEIHQKLTKEEARILLVEIVELFLHNINGNSAIASFLYNSPFTFKNLEFRVFIYDKDGSDIFHPNLGLVSLTRVGTVNFVTYQQDTLCDYVLDIEEPYEEAYKIVTQGIQPEHVPEDV